MRKFYYKKDDFIYRHALDETVDASQYPPHTHMEAELLFVLSGEGIFHVEGRGYSFAAGDVLLTRPLESHYMEVKDGIPYERIVVNFPLSALSETELTGRLLKPFTERKAGMQNLYRGALFSTDYPLLFKEKILAPGGEVFIRPFVSSVLAEISVLFEKGSNKNAEKETPEYRMIRYINQHLNEKLTAEMLGKKYYVSIAQLERRFKKVTGTTTAEYIHTKRMLLARRLLSDGERPTEIFLRCGFSDYSSFYRAYKKYFGVSPKVK